MHPNAALIEKLYTGLRALDPETMADCYHPQAVFSDPVFPRLEGEEVPAMWRMLCAGARDLNLEFHDAQADDDTGSARLEAVYTFPATGRRIHNIITARFTFQDGRILRHEDRFGLWRWSRMALGPTGTLIGWTPMVRAKIRKQAARALKASRQNG